MERIVRGYWDCRYCKKTQIDGLLDKCPDCGGGKPSDIKYYMLGDSPSTIKKVDYLSEAELNSAGIAIDECDGNHKEWICDYCGWTNNYADTTCASCGSSKLEHTKEYGNNSNKK
jgi:rubrerythrin